MIAAGDSEQTAWILDVMLLAGAALAALPAVFALRAKRPLARRALLAAAALVALILVAGSAWTVHRGILQGEPYSGDESSMRFQARLFSEGQLWARPLAGEVQPFFTRHHVVVDGDKEYSKYPPGQALLLAAAMRLGSETAANVVVTGLCLLLFLACARLLSGGWRVPLLGALPFLLSTTVLFHAASWFSHPAAMLLVLATVVARTLAQRGSTGMGRVRWGLAGGVSLGLLLLVRPFDAGLTAVALGASRLWDLLASPDRRSSWRAWARLDAGLLAFLGGAAVGAALFLGYQKLYTGSWLLSPYRVYDPKGELVAELTFTVDQFLSNGLGDLALYWLGEQAAWSSAAVMLLAVLYWIGRRTLSAPASDRPLVLLPVVFVLGYAFHNTWGGHAFGARYYYPVLWCWFYGAAAFIDGLARRSLPRRAAFLYLVFAAAVALPFPLQVAEKCSFVSGEVAARLSIYRTAEGLVPAGEKAVVLLGRTPKCDASFFVQNEPALGDRILYASDLPNRSLAPLRRTFPERSIYRLDFDDEQGAFLVQRVSGPAPASAGAGP
jgi:hypothetical protein